MKICPVCGAYIAEGSEICNVCKVHLQWKDGVPIPVKQGKGWNIVLLISAISVILFFVLFLWYIYSRF